MLQRLRRLQVDQKRQAGTVLDEVKSCHSLGYFQKCTHYQLGDRPLKHFNNLELALSCKKKEKEKKIENLRGAAAADRRLLLLYVLPIYRQDEAPVKYTLVNVSLFFQKTQR